MISHADELAKARELEGEQSSDSKYTEMATRLLEEFGTSALVMGGDLVLNPLCSARHA